MICLSYIKVSISNLIQSKVTVNLTLRLLAHYKSLQRHNLYLMSNTWAIFGSWATPVSVARLWAEARFSPIFSFQPFRCFCQFSKKVSFRLQVIFVSKIKPGHPQDFGFLLPSESSPQSFLKMEKEKASGRQHQYKNKGKDTEVG